MLVYENKYYSISKLYATYLYKVIYYFHNDCALCHLVCIVKLGLHRVLHVLRTKVVTFTRMYKLVCMPKRIL